MIYDSSVDRLLIQGAPKSPDNQYPGTTYRLSTEQHRRWKSASVEERAAMLLHVYDHHAGGKQLTFGMIHIIWMNTFGGIASQPPRGVNALLFKEMLNRLARPPETYEEEIDILAEAEYSGGVKIFKIFRDYMKAQDKSCEWTKKMFVDHLTKPAMVILAEAGL